MSLVTRGFGPGHQLSTFGLGPIVVEVIVLVPRVIEVRPPIRTRVRIVNTHTFYDSLEGTLCQPVGLMNNFEIELDDPLVVSDGDGPRIIKIVTLSRGKIEYLVP